MAITREQLEKAAKAAGIEVQEDVSATGIEILSVPYSCHGMMTAFAWQPNIDRGQLFSLAMACRICIDPRLNQIKWTTGSCYAVRIRHQYVNCQDLPALAEAVILAACEQFDAKGGE